MFKKKSKSSISIELNDYVLRAIVNKGAIQQAEVIEWRLAPGIIQDGAIVDEMALYESVKENTSKLARKHPVRFFVPDTSVLLKQIDIPEDLEEKDLRGYVEMELGNSIHLPFQDPLVDTYDPVPGDGKASLFAVPPEEVQKFIHMLLDLNLSPEAADIRALCNLRLLDYLELLEQNKTYLISDWSINECSICIYSAGNVEFLRYQTIETDMEQWHEVTEASGELNFEYEGDVNDYRLIVTDQVLELDRMMNFFKFSLHKGEKSVDEIVIMGDNPLLENITELLQENFQMPIHSLSDEIIQKQFPNMRAKHATLIGLALKEVK